jgi:hypothetical protein
LEPIEVSVDVTEGDYLEFCTYLSESVKSRKRRKLAHLITDVLVAFFLAYLIYRYWSDIHWPTALVMGLVAFYLYGFVVTPLFEGAEAAVPKQNGLVLGKRHYVFSLEGIAESTSYHSGKYNWSIVDGVQETENLIVIMLDSAAGVILPRRDLSEGEALLELIRSKIAT